MDQLQPIRNDNIPATLKHLGSKPMVQFLQAGRMDKARELMPMRIEQTIKGTPICLISQVVDPIRVEAFVSFLLIEDVVKMWNGDARLNLQPGQVPVIAKMLIDTFRNENLADFAVCFRRGVMGMYNDENNKLLRIDGSVLTSWMRKYLEEKYEVVESALKKEKESFYRVKKAVREEDKPNPKRNLLALLQEVIGEVTPQEDNNKKVNEYERYKLENKRKLTEDQLRAIIKQEYPNATEEEIRQFILNYDLP